jgi:hypothetical protein
MACRKAQRLSMSYGGDSSKDKRAKDIHHPFKKFFAETSFQLFPSYLSEVAFGGMILA